MPKAVVKLTDAKIRKAPIKNKPYKLSDGEGLYLLVRTNGSKLWRFDYTRPSGKRNTMSFGKYPEISLSEAREKRLDARKKVANKIDPSDTRKTSQEETFKAIATEWLKTKESEWKPSHMKKNRSRLENDLLPWLGNRPIKEITAKELLATLRRIENRCTGDAASRCKSIAGQIFRYAIATGRAERDVSRDLDGALRKPVSGNFPAITDPEELATLLRDIDHYNGRFITCCALRFTPLVFQRPGEVRHAEWSEINLDEARWDIPAEKMKLGKKHFIPLSRQAVELLREIHPLTGQGKYVFPATTQSPAKNDSTAKPLSENTVNLALKKLGYAGAMTAHGLRATARTILNEVLGFSPPVIEKQLAHAVADPLGESYNRAQHIDERIKMMQQWADYLDGLKEDKAKVIPINRTA